MKAIRIHEFGSPEVMQYEETAALQPGPGQILVKAAAIGVNPVEAYIRSGSYSRMPVLPYTPGSDTAGTVEAAGSEITSFKIGDRIYTSGSISGAYAEYSLCTESQVHPLPDNISFQQGAAIGIPYGTAYRALFQKASALAGETVLIHGASGGVGMACIQLARAAGLVVIATGGSDSGRTLIKEQGADHVLDHTSRGYLDMIQSITSGKGVDVILEMRAETNLAGDLNLIARNGRIIVIGSRGNVEINPRELMAKDADAYGMVLFNTSEPELRCIHSALKALLSLNVLKPVIGKKVPLRDASRAHHMIMEEKAYGKIVLLP
jgi:NADPH:quinone reductase